MKKWMLCLAVVICAICLVTPVSLAGEVNGLAWPTAGIDWVSIKRTDSEDTIHLGSSRADAEKVLGAPLAAESSLQLIPYEGGIEIAYRDDVVCALRLRLEDSQTCAYELGNGISFSSSMEDVLKAYEPPMKWIGSFWEALAENVDGEWKLVNIEDYAGGPKNLNDTDNINRYVFIDIIGGEDGLESVNYYEACFAKFLR